MDRATIYYGQLPRETDLLNAQQFAMVALAKLTEGVLGTATAVDAFAVTPTSPASLNVILTPGQVFQIENLESSIWSALPADTAHSIVKQGVLLNPVVFGITPPTTTGYSQVFLVQVQYQDVDGGSTVLPYYNSSNPQTPYLGPGNAGSAQNTTRKGAVAAQVKAGIAASTGAQVAPTADAGWIGLYTITVANGASSITSGNIALVSTSPFIPVKLPAVPAGVQSGQWLYAADTGAANTLVATLNPIPAQLVPGMTVRIKIANNNTGAMTFNPNGLGASAIVKANGVAMASGDVIANMILELTWTGSSWQATNFLGILSSSSTVTNTYTVSIPYAVDSSGTPNAITATFSPAITSLSAGLVVDVKLANAVTGATTIAVNGLTAVPVICGDGAPLGVNDASVGEVLRLAFDGTSFQLAGGWSAQMSIVGARRNFVAKATGVDANVTITADQLVVENSSNGHQKTIRNISLTINTAASGANGLDTGTLAAGTWYAKHVIFNGSTVAGLISLSGTAPTLPSGYTKSARTGWIKTDGGSKYPLGFVQRDYEVAFSINSVAPSNVPDMPTMAVGPASGGSGVWTPIGVDPFVPATAKKIKIMLGAYQGNWAAAAPNPNYFASLLTGASFVAPVMGFINVGWGQVNMEGEFILESRYIYWQNGYPNAAAVVKCTGWTDA